MKKKLFISALIALSLPATVIAQSETNTANTKNKGDVESTTSVKAPKAKTQATTVAKGVTVSITKDFMDIKAKVSGTGFSIRGRDDADQVIGLGLGYSNIKLKQLGLSIEGIISKYDILDNNDLYSFRINGNGTLGVHKLAYLYAGINVSRTLLEEESKVYEFEYNPGLGFQVGAAVQITPNFAFRAGYAQMNNEIEVESKFFSVDNLKFSYNFRGFEASLIGTF